MVGRSAYQVLAASCFHISIASPLFGVSPCFVLLSLSAVIFACCFFSVCCASLCLLCALFSLFVVCCVLFAVFLSVCGVLCLLVCLLWFFACCSLCCVLCAVCFVLCALYCLLCLYFAVGSFSFVVSCVFCSVCHLLVFAVSSSCFWLCWILPLSINQCFSCAVISSLVTFSGIRLATCFFCLLLCLIYDYKLIGFSLFWSSQQYLYYLSFPYIDVCSLRTIKEYLRNHWS